MPPVPSFQKSLKPPADKIGAGGASGELTQLPHLLELTILDSNLNLFFLQRTPVSIHPSPPMD